VSLVPSLFFVFVFLSFPSVFVVTTHTMVKLQNHRPQEATFPVPVRKLCSGSGEFLLNVPVLVETEAKALCVEGHPM
jgi:hypothetical protein